MIAVGTGKLDENGKVVPFGEKRRPSLDAKYGDTEVKVDGNEYQIVREDDILALLDKLVRRYRKWQSKLFLIQKLVTRCCEESKN